ncbi:hypothetical protein LH612_36580, partial [Klebsiella pneumoniae]|nr:hypothetical protein [Klebsiella pneumoniae]
MPELREFNGLDEEVRNYVLGQEGAEEFLQSYQQLLRLVGAGYHREGKRYLTLALGCTGGKHRSVALAEELARRLAAGYLVVDVRDRQRYARSHLAGTVSFGLDNSLVPWLGWLVDPGEPVT